MTSSNEDKRAMSTYTTDWSKPDTFPGGATQYRIEVKREAHGWFQRHIWRFPDGAVIPQEWIPTFDHDGRLDGFVELAA